MTASFPKCFLVVPHPGTVGVWKATGTELFCNFTGSMPGVGAQDAGMSTRNFVTGLRNAGFGGQIRNSLYLIVRCVCVGVKRGIVFVQATEGDSTRAGRPSAVDNRWLLADILVI